MYTNNMVIAVDNIYIYATVLKEDIGGGRKMGKEGLKSQVAEICEL